MGTPLPITEHILAILGDASGIGTIGGATGWRIGVGRMPDTPDTSICIYDSPGEHPNSKWLLDYPYVQVIVRGSPDGYQAARQKAQDVYDVLFGCSPRAMPNGDNIDAITVVGNPSHVGNDQKNRPMISANYRIIFEPQPSALTNREPL